MSKVETLRLDLETIYFHKRCVFGSDAFWKFTLKNSKSSFTTQTRSWTWHVISGEADGLNGLIVDGQEMRRGRVQIPPLKVSCALVVLCVQIEQKACQWLCIGEIVYVNEGVRGEELLVVFSWGTQNYKGPIDLLKWEVKLTVRNGWAIVFISQTVPCKSCTEDVDLNVFGQFAIISFSDSCSSGGVVVAADNSLLVQNKVIFHFCFLDNELAPRRDAGISSAAQCQVE